jgi:hypothetical protein
MPTRPSVPRARGRTLLSVTAAAVLAACSDAPGRVTGPQANAAQPVASRGATAPNVAMCRLAVRSPSGTYLTRAVEIRMPRRIVAVGSETTPFGYRGWKEGESDPVRLAQCEIPATAVAEEWFAQLFAGNRTDGVFRGAPGRNPGRHVKEAAEARTTASVSVYDGYSEPCIPYEQVDAFDTEGATTSVDWECGGGGGGWETGEEWDGPAPAEPEYVDGEMEIAPNPSAEASAEMASAVPLSCSGQTDNPHRSGTAGFTHNANVHGRTVCSAAVQMSVSVMLQRQRCVWFFCWWSGVGTNGYGAGVATRLERTSNAPCQTGYWRGQSNHTVTPPPGYWPLYGSFSTSRIANISRC